MTQDLIRFGFHDFLNAQPLLVPLKRLASQAGCEMVVGSPAEIADQLAQGSLDLGMIPSIEFLKSADRYELLPAVSIASRGVVGTVLLICNKPVKQVRTLALDERSRTSVALLMLLLGEVWPSETIVRPAEPDIETMLKENDAALIIGDQALHAKKYSQGRTVFDLSQAWYEQTGKTFVHAVVAVPQETVLDSRIRETVKEAKRQGKTNLSLLAKSLAPEHNLSEKACETYLRENIIYDLGEEELEGLVHFRDLCVEKGLLKIKHPIRFS